MITRSERPLTDDERRALAERLERARTQSRTALAKTGVIGAAVCGVLAVLTLLASDAPAAVVLAFWAAIWVLLTLWIGIPQRKLMRGQVPILEDALRVNRAREIRLQATRVVEFEEEEDEGACYAFETEPGSIVFIVGQEFYDDDDFPNSDFSMIEILGRSGQPADVLVTKRGGKLVPERVIPAAMKNRLEIPEHLTEVGASLDQIEASLATTRDGRR